MYLYQKLSIWSKHDWLKLLRASESPCFSASVAESFMSLWPPCEELLPEKDMLTFRVRKPFNWEYLHTAQPASELVEQTLAGKS